MKSFHIMKPSFPFFIASLLCILVSCGGKEEPENNEPQEPEPQPEVNTGSKGGYKHVVIIGVDGAGAFFKNTDTPSCDEIFADQATTYTCLVGMPSMSAQGWGSILHGVLPEYHGLTNDIIKNTPYPTNSPYPSIFKVVREAMPNAELASFVEWNPINIGIVEDGLSVEKGTGGNDGEVTRKILSYLTGKAPSLLFIQFSSPDDIGEAYGFGSAIYLKAISTADAYIGMIYDQLKQKDLLDDTLFIVTADHGGINKTHGGNSDAEKYVFLGVAGRTVSSGTIVEAELRDVAAIAAYALGIECPKTWTGRVPAGVFEDVTEAEEHHEPGEEYRKHQTEPTPALSNMQTLLSGHNVIAYLPFDENINDAFGKVQTSQSGTLQYYDAYYGKGVALNNGYVTLKNVKVGTGSFSVAFWLKGSPLTPEGADPGLISNKDWQEGKYKGFILSYRGSKDIKFNVGKGETENKYRMDYVRYLPDNYDTGWMHVILTVDRPSRKVHIYLDFISDGAGEEIPTFFDNVSFDSLNLNIGQDGTGSLEYKLPAQMDEFIMTSDVLSEADVAALQAYYEPK